MSFIQTVVVCCCSSSDPSHRYGKPNIISAHIKDFRAECRLLFPECTSMFVYMDALKSEHRCVFNVIVTSFSLISLLLLHCPW